MRMRVLDWLFAAGLIGLAAPTLGQTQKQPEHGSTEQDYREERQEGLQARQQAMPLRRQAVQQRGDGRAACFPHLRQRRSPPDCPAP